MPAKQHTLEADGIQVQFDNRNVLSGVYLRVQTGQVVALLGANGSGKSTLLQTVFGARVVPDASVRVDGHPVMPAYRQPGLMSYLPQTELWPSGMALASAARLLGVSLEQALVDFPALQKQVVEGSTRAGLSGGTGRLIQTLVLLARRSRFLLLDEPFSGVMPVHIEQLSHCLRAARAHSGILLTDHRYQQVLDVADVVYLLRHGRLQLLAEPRAELRDLGYLPD
ncbi:ATP-binding cassette domain-containing protein [Hymenobacter sp. J193]|uniref:ATP-binding cassette domain-containing protein n=1 Tax=Hymenobacter sp. J193 TaxID=2898429 RepID=UPI002151A125|nr:ATP-binding cassette domain-containing protein [Hymenobacter sp. J193]MCR5889149.1 ATP-binding cassette domain-containing protein [Hymenobacter sp. J193]